MRLDHDLHPLCQQTKTTNENSLEDDGEKSQKINKKNELDGGGYINYPGCPMNINGSSGL